MSARTISTFTIIALLFFSFFFFTLTQSARAHAPFSDNNSFRHQREVFDAENIEMGENSNCERVGKEECLMRRTFAAHLDYIYTQKQKP